jgi:hypothetical protein
MKLIAIIGFNHADKRTITQAIAEQVIANGHTVTLIDNADSAMKLPYPTYRIPGGCVCCGAAYGMYAAVEQIESEFTLMIASNAAVPEALHLVLDGLNRADISVIIVAVIDATTADRVPYHAAQLALNADIVLTEPYDLRLLTLFA